MSAAVQRQGALDAPPVKRSLTRKRRHRETETPDFLAMVERLLRRAGERVADADDVDLAQLVRLRDLLDSTITDAVRGQRERHGRSWADVARGLGTSRQAAQQRYGKDHQ